MTSAPTTAPPSSPESNEEPEVDIARRIGTFLEKRAKLRAMVDQQVLVLYAKGEDVRESVLVVRQQQQRTREQAFFDKTEVINTVRKQMENRVQGEKESLKGSSPTKEEVKKSTSRRGRTQREWEIEKAVKGLM